jgi:hypothetical protein
MRDTSEPAMERLVRARTPLARITAAGELPSAARQKRELPDLTSDLGLLRLCANKKEVCAFGTIA